MKQPLAFCKNLIKKNVEKNIWNNFFQLGKPGQYAMKFNGCIN